MGNSKEIVKVNEEADWQLPISIEEIRKYYAPDATDTEFQLFVDQMKANKLDVRKRECYFIKYGGKKGQIVTGYQVYIARAEATGRLNGWSCVVDKDDKGNVVGATITIHRKDWDHPFVWPVLIEECENPQAPIWKKMRSFMVRKVCIGQGFRLAFSEVLGDLPYLSEEIADMMEPNRTIQIDPEPGDIDAEIVEPEAPATEKKTTKKKTTKKKAAKKPPEEPEEEPEVVEPEVVEPEVVDTEVPEPTAPVSPLLPTDKREACIAAFDGIGISADTISTVLGTEDWNEDHRSWLLTEYENIQNGDLDADGFSELRYKHD